MSKRKIEKAIYGEILSNQEMIDKLKLNSLDDVNKAYNNGDKLLAVSNYHKLVMNIDTLNVADEKIHINGSLAYSSTNIDISGLHLPLDMFEYNRYFSIIKYQDVLLELFGLDNNPEKAEPGIKIEVLKSRTKCHDIKYLEVGKVYNINSVVSSLYLISKVDIENQKYTAIKIPSGITVTINFSEIKTSVLHNMLECVGDIEFVYDIPQNGYFEDIHFACINISKVKPDTSYTLRCRHGKTLFGTLVAFTDTALYFKTIDKKIVTLTESGRVKVDSDDDILGYIKLNTTVDKLDMFMHLMTHCNHFTFTANKLKSSNVISGFRKFCDLLDTKLESKSYPVYISNKGCLVGVDGVKELQVVHHDMFSNDRMLAIKFMGVSNKGVFPCDKVIAENIPHHVLAKGEEETVKMLELVNEIKSGAFENNFKTIENIFNKMK